MVAEVLLLVIPLPALAYHPFLECDQCVFSRASQQLVPGRTMVHCAPPLCQVPMVFLLGSEQLAEFLDGGRGTDVVNIDHNIWDTLENGLHGTLVQV